LNGKRIIKFSFTSSRKIVSHLRETPAIYKELFIYSPRISQPFLSTHRSRARQNTEFKPPKWYLLAQTPSLTLQGKRKKAAKRPTGRKKLDPLPTTFSCLFCNHDDSVVCKLDKVHRIGNLICKVCGQGHQCVINSLFLCLMSADV
jgi:Transcription elongation factor Elf1 like